MITHVGFIFGSF